ncbi:MAG: protein-disulfide reductase DsbD family protein [Saprospiraceae bacterium]|nr:protein-disulfide reductase DsbD family protein [Saprospiraceae bacterium]
MRITFVLLFCIISLAATAQLDPVTWSYKAKKVNATEYDLILTADVDNGWYIYSQFLESDEGPIATSFTFEENENYELVGEAKEQGNKKEGFDEIFAMKLVKYSGKVSFTQRIKVKEKTDKVTGNLEFMTCDDEKCLPPKMLEFAIVLK